MLSKRSLLPLILTLSLFPCLHAKPLRVAGSDLLRAPLQESLEAEARKLGVEAKLEFSGSGPALAGLAEKPDLLLLALPDETVPAGYVGFPLAFQVVAVAVHDSNPTGEISMDQLESLYGEGGAQTIEQWGQIKEEGSWSNRQIVSSAIRQRDNLALEVFKALVLQGRPMKSSITFWESPEALFREVNQNPVVISLSPTTAAPSGVKILAVSKGKAERAFGPTPENVLFGDYPLRLAFYLLRPSGSVSGEQAALMRHLLSDAVAARLSEHLLMPLPAGERREHELEIDNKR